jgi:hypothetical protein
MITSEKLIHRYNELKCEAEGCLLVMQVMEEDARNISSITGLKLKMAGDIDNRGYQLPVDSLRPKKWIPLIVNV